MDETGHGLRVLLSVPYQDAVARATEALKAQVRGPDECRCSADVASEASPLSLDGLTGFWWRRRNRASPPGRELSFCRLCKGSV
jgi:hypothetical protein